MNDMIVFSNENLGSVRTVNRDGEPWFVANDVCKVLEMGNPRQALSRLDADERDVHIMDTPGGEQRINIISESGLYAFILTSRKPQAHAFKRWITHDVIPAIRKTGHYSTKPGITIDPEALTMIVSTVMTETAKQMIPMVGTVVSETMKQIIPLIHPGKEPTPPMIEAPKKGKRKRNPVLLRDFVDLLNQVMREQKVNGKQVAQRMKVSKTTVSNWRTGKSRPGRDNYLRFVLEFNVPIDDLREGVF